jgi:rhomboid protease GluP
MNPPDYGMQQPEPVAQPAQHSWVKLPDTRPIVTFAIIGLTVLVYLGQVASQYMFGQDYFELFGLKINELIQQGQYWRLFTPMLLHASILHIGFNMYALYIFGPTLERFYGHWRFLILYVISGFAGNVLSFLLSASASLGASTAIFGLLGAQGVFLYQNRELFGKQAQRSLRDVIFIGAINLLLGLTTPAIDIWGHIGGLLGGVSFAWLGGPKLHVEGIPPNLHAADERESADVLRAALIVGVIFALIAGGTILLRGG